MQDVRKMRAQGRRFVAAEKLTEARFLTVDIDISSSADTDAGAMVVSIGTIRVIDFLSGRILFSIPHNAGGGQD